MTIASGFYPLTVTAVERETRDAVVLTLQPAPQDADKFQFTQGQYLTFRREFHGEELRRSYSICAGRDDGRLQVGIKKVEDGWFSGWANDSLQAGEILQAMPPAGSFFTPLDASQQKHYLCFAGGSGITPVLSIIKTTLASEPQAKLTLVYGNRSSNSIMFREVLEDLKNSHMGRLNIIHILERESQDIDLFNGLVDQQKCADLFRFWIDIESVDMAFICGPKPMMLAISDALKSHGLADSKVKFELFAAAKRGLTQAPKQSAEAEKKQAAYCLATIRLGGVARQVELEKRTETILDAALKHGVDAPYACKSGVCSTCRAKVITGEVEMDTNFALEDYEVRQGYILSCQSYPITDEIEVDYDQ